MKKMFLMAVAALMATMTFAQAWEWKLLSSTNPEDFVNVSEQEGKDAAIKLGQNCVYFCDGDYCWYTNGGDVTKESWSTISVYIEFDIILYYPAAKAAEPEAIDLGLSVNWATFNIGATKPQGMGDYFAWGETATKAEFTKENYTYSDNPAVLPASADAAAQIWGGEWRMPTKEEAQELKDNCTWEWTTENGRNGMRVTSNKEGYTDKSIFLPTAGFYTTFGSNTETEGNYRTSTLNKGDAETTWCLIFDEDGPILYNYTYRYMGYSIRPVCPKPSTPTALENTNADTNADRKVMRNGQLLIIRDGVTYDAQGAIVK